METCHLSGDFQTKRIEKPCDFRRFHLGFECQVKDLMVVDLALEFHRRAKAEWAIEFVFFWKLLSCNTFFCI